MHYFETATRSVSSAQLSKWFVKRLCSGVVRRPLVLLSRSELHLSCSEVIFVLLDKFDELNS